MSGGTFYNKLSIYQTAEEIQSIIDNSDPQEYPDEILAEFKKAIDLLKIAYIYVHRIDYLVASDDSIETFKEMLAQDLQIHKDGVFIEKDL